MKSRHQARIIALQTLYETDCANHAPGVVVEQRLAEVGLSSSAADFARRLVKGVLDHVPVLDAFIHRHAPEWPLEQMAYIDRNILRLAIFEFAVDGQAPLKVVINEAVELAKEYGSDSAARFVNGVLGSLVKRKTAIVQAVSDSAARNNS